MLRLVLVLATASASPVRATDSDALLGEWEQVAANAGACPTCRIVFHRVEPGFSIKANNGWAAGVSDMQGGEVVGAGRWEEGRRSWVAGRPFTIRFQMNGDYLVMTMTVAAGRDGVRIVRGTYRRAWQGV